MLIPIKIKKNSNNVKTLITKRNEYIAHKKPILHKWAWNYLFTKGIDRAALKWRFEQVPPEMELVEEVTETNDETGRSTRPVNRAKQNAYNNNCAYRTFEDVYGKYRYNSAGIPAKHKEYKSDILSRQISAKVSSSSFDYNITSFFQKLLLNNLLGDKSFSTYLDRIVDDILIKNKSYLRVESFNLLRNVRVWDKIDFQKNDKWDFVWDDKEKLPYKRGVFAQYVDPECVFPEPNTKTPSEYFIGIPYTKNELLLNFPELSSIKDDLIAENPFPYKVAEDIEFIYHNYKTLSSGSWISPDIFGNNGWLNGLWNMNDKFYNAINKEQYFWVWHYYHLASNPVDNTSGDYCCVFINDYELYSAPIPEADKSCPLVSFEMNSSRDYYGISMIDELKPIQEDINDMENVKRSQINWLATSNVAINKTLMDDGDISLSRHKINIINLKTQEEEEMEQTGMNMGNRQLSVANVIQNFTIGNPEAVNIANVEIQRSLQEMDTQYPKPLYKVQLQPEAGQTQTSYSPVLPVHTIIQKIGDSMSVVGEKFIKENIGFIRYLNNTIKAESKDDESKKKKAIKILQAIGLDNLKIIVAKNDKDKQKIQDRKLIELFLDLQKKAREEQQQKAMLQAMAGGGNMEQMRSQMQNLPALTPEQFKPTESQMETIRQEIAPMDDTTYFIFENLIMLGTEDIDLNVKIGKTKEELIRSIMEFVNMASSMGVYTDNSKLLTQIANLYDISLEMLLTNPPDSTTQQMLKNFRMNMLLYPDGTLTSLVAQRMMGFEPEQVKFNPNNASLQEWILKTNIAKENTMETTEESAKSQAKSKIATEQAKIQRELMDQISNQNPENLARNQSSNFMPAPRPDNPPTTNITDPQNPDIPNQPNNQSLATQRFSNPEL